MGHLAIRDLGVEFRRRVGLRRETVVGLGCATLDVRPGEVLALVGASGGGKSLLAHAVLGLLPPNARVRGEVRLDGQPLDEAALRGARGRRLALVPQSPTHLDPLAPVGRQLAWAGRRGGRAVDVGLALAAVGLPAASAALRPAELSGGMARRALLAAALGTGADTILADEPTDGLDPRNAATVLATLRQAADAGGAVLLITHDLALAIPVADRVVTLWDGATLPAEAASAFRGVGDDLRHEASRRLWQAVPQNGFQAGERGGA